jgi:hypothetical protein
VNQFQLKARTQLVGAPLRLIHCALLRTQEHYIRKEAAHAFTDGIRDRYMKQKRLTGGEKTPPAEGRRHNNRNLRQTLMNECRMSHKLEEERRVQYGVPLPLARAITKARERLLRRGRYFGMAVVSSDRTALRALLKAVILEPENTPTACQRLDKHISQETDSPSFYRPVNGEKFQYSEL